MVRVLLLMALLSPWLSLHGAIETYTFSSVENEQRYKRMVDELRCLVCQNQNLQDSNAELAQDLRKKVHFMIEDGQSDQQIIDFMVARYGDFVLYKPPFNTSTLFLWFGPFLLMLLGFTVLLKMVRNRSREKTQSVAPEDLERARELLQSKQDEQDTKA